MITELTKEIKFRIWSVHYQLYITQSTGLKLKLNLNGQIYVDALNITDRYVIEQYTGLKDRNGVEIYEGDVLEFVGGTCDVLPVGYPSHHHQKGTILVVQHLKSGFTLQLPRHVGKNIPSIVGNVDNYMFWSHQRSFNIISNIHENPELLKP